MNKIDYFYHKNRNTIILFFKHLQVQITIRGQFSEVNCPGGKSKCFFKFILIINDKIVNLYSEKPPRTLTLIQWCTNIITIQYV